MSLNNYKIKIAYDGSNLLGWQVQKTGRTVQGDIETALKKIFKQHITLIGAGRTDSGVHALRQVANFKVNRSMDPISLKAAINGNLNKDIYITDCYEAEEDFHSRFSATKREYEYKIQTIYKPTDRNYVWSLDNNDINMNLLNNCADLILGEHDFTQLSKKNEELENKLCYVYDSKWDTDDICYTYTIRANRFLHHMVRYLVGIMIEISKGHSLSVSDFSSMLNAEQRKMIFKAPSKGLYLKKVYYD